MICQHFRISGTEKKFAWAWWRLLSPASDNTGFLHGGLFFPPFFSLPLYFFPREVSASPKKATPPSLVSLFSSSCVCLTIPLSLRTRGPRHLWPFVVVWKSGSRIRREKLVFWSQSQCLVSRARVSSLCVQQSVPVPGIKNREADERDRLQRVSVARLAKDASWRQ